MVGRDRLALNELLATCRLAQWAHVAVEASVRLGMTRVPDAETSRYRRGRCGLTQLDAARLLGDFTPRSYIRWEREGTQVPAAVLPGMTVVLGMNAGQRRRLHRLTFPGRQDPHRGLPQEEQAELAWWRDRLACLRYPAFLVDTAMRHVGANTSLYDLLPEARGERSVARLVLGPEAGKALLHWGPDWAVPVFSVAWRLYIACPWSFTLYSLMCDVAAEERLSEVWRARESGFPVAVGSRVVDHPVMGRTAGTVLVCDPLHPPAAGFRVVAFRPEGWS
jgi:hypothetical protein